MRSFSILAALLLLLSSCGNRQEGNRKPVVTVTIEPLAYFTDRLAGSWTEINVLVPPGSSPATYEPSPKQMKRLLRSGLLVLNGELGMEKAWQDRFRSGNKAMEVLVLSQYQDIIEGEKHPGHSHHDPHFWISPASAMKIVPPLADHLVRLVPQKEDSIRLAGEQLLQEITALHRETDSLLRDSGRKTFMIFHPALSYLARDYGLQQIAIEHEGKEPGLKHVRNLVDQAKDLSIDCVFVQKEFNRESARAVAGEIGARLVVIDPLSRDWFRTVRQIVRSLASEEIPVE